MLETFPRPRLSLCVLKKRGVLKYNIVRRFSITVFGGKSAHTSTFFFRQEVCYLSRYTALVQAAPCPPLTTHLGGFVLVLPETFQGRVVLGLLPLKVLQGTCESHQGHRVSRREKQQRSIRPIIHSYCGTWSHYYCMLLTI